MQKNSLQKFKMKSQSLLANFGLVVRLKRGDEPYFDTHDKVQPCVVVRLTLLSVSVQNMTGEDLRKDFSPWILVVK